MARHVVVSMVGQSFVTYARVVKTVLFCVKVPTCGTRGVVGFVAPLDWTIFSPEPGISPGVHDRKR